jgi:bacterioferritin-associated ferredoxin
MYVCSCNAISDQAAEAAIRSGARRLAEVYRGCGCEAQCGTCAKAMLELLRGPAEERERCG